SSTGLEFLEYESGTVCNAFLDALAKLQLGQSKNEKNISDEPNDDQKPNAILIDTDFPNDPLSTNEISNKFYGNFSEEPNPDDLLSSVVDPHHLVTSSGFSIQCKKYVLNRVILNVTWGYADPTFFRGGG
ncbi:unnamed protein product, partial [Schistosoma mattheei]